MAVSKNSGVVLVTMLIFMQILAMFSLLVLESARLEMKMSRNFHAGHVLDQSAYQMLKSTEQAVLTDELSCKVGAQNVQFFMDQSEDAWRAMGACLGSFQNTRFFYVVEDLGNDGCAYTAELNGETKAVNYSRITLLAVSQRSQRKRLLQSTVVRSIATKEPCDYVRHPVQRGRQMWRVLG